MSARRQAALVASQAAKLATDFAPPLSYVAALVGQLAQIIAGQLAEDVPRLQAGDEVELTLRVRATVVEVHDVDGLCYQVDLEQRDYVAGRTVSIDHDEILSATRRS